MVARGAVYWIDLDRRLPCVVVSSHDVLGVEVWQTHIVPLTSNLDRAGLAGNVLLESAATGLSRDSVAVPLGLELIDRSWLTDYVGRLPTALTDAIDEGLGAVLGAVTASSTPILTGLEPNTACQVTINTAKQPQQRHCWRLTGLYPTRFHSIASGSPSRPMYRQFKNPPGLG